MSNIKRHHFTFSDSELEIANVLIRDGWEGDLASLQIAAELLNDNPHALSPRRYKEFLKGVNQ